MELIHKAHEICRAAGVQFCGIQRPEPDLGFNGLVLFNEPCGSTLAVPLPTVSVSAIHARLIEFEANNPPAGEPFLEFLRR